MMDATFTAPTTLYRGTGDYEGLACSEPDPYAPEDSPMLWVPLAGGPVTADVKVDERADGWDAAEQGDPWDCGIDTGLTMTHAEVCAALGFVEPTTAVKTTRMTHGTKDVFQTLRTEFRNLDDDRFYVTEFFDRDGAPGHSSVSVHVAEDEVVGARVCDNVDDGGWLKLGVNVSVFLSRAQMVGIASELSDVLNAPPVDRPVTVSEAAFHEYDRSGSYE